MYVRIHVIFPEITGSIQHKDFDYLDESIELGFNSSESVPLRGIRKYLSEAFRVIPNEFENVLYLAC